MQGGSPALLLQKLGVKPGYPVALLHAPAYYLGLFETYPRNLLLIDYLEGQLSFIQFFATNYKQLAVSFSRLKVALEPAGALWISWPHNASGLVTDLHEDNIRALGLSAGLAPMKIETIDEIWSGMKFEYHLSVRANHQI
jgi:hypothetical protein